MEETDGREKYELREERAWHSPPTPTPEREILAEEIAGAARVTDREVFGI
jgi:hypothetical protein